MDSLELRGRAERYRKLAAECRSDELAKLLKVYAEAYEEEAVFVDGEALSPGRPRLCG